MVLIDEDWAPPEERSSVPSVLEDEVNDADVRVRITFPSEFREAMRADLQPALDRLRSAAHSVIVEERPIVISRTRCSEISAARTTAEKLRAWAQAVEVEVPAGAEAKLGILEGEVAP
jgi:hypothetical protein